MDLRHAVITALAIVNCSGPHGAKTWQKHRQSASTPLRTALSATRSWPTWLPPINIPTVIADVTTKLLAFIVAHGPTLRSPCPLISTLCAIPDRSLALRRRHLLPLRTVLRRLRPGRKREHCHDAQQGRNTVAIHLPSFCRIAAVQNQPSNTYYSVLMRTVYAVYAAP